MRLARILWSQTQKVSNPPPAHCTGTAKPLQVPELRRDTVGSGFRKTGQATICRVNWRERKEDSFGGRYIQVRYVVGLSSRSMRRFSFN